MIAPNATNEVGAPHTFTVTVQQDTGAGFVAGGGRACRLQRDDSSERERCGRESGAAVQPDHERVRSVHDHVHVGDAAAR